MPFKLVKMLRVHSEPESWTIYLCKRKKAIAVRNYLSPFTLRTDPAHIGIKGKAPVVKLQLYNTREPLK